MSDKYLNLDGLTTYDVKIKEYFDESWMSPESIQELCDNNLVSEGGIVVGAIAKDVNFYDYDGTILHSYTKESFLALPTMPGLPKRKGLTCQGWNYTLDEAKSYVSDYGSLDIGAMYITSDGATKLYISILDEGRMDVPLYFNQTVSNGVTIDWGDGTTETIEGVGNVNTTRKYKAPGDYIIQLIPSDQCSLSLGNNGGTENYCLMGSITPLDRVYSNMLRKVELGRNITTISPYAFNSCCNLKSISLPNSITLIDNYAFESCHSLASIVVPQNTTRVGRSAFYVCRYLSVVCLPPSVEILGDERTEDGGVFSNCFALKSINIPKSVTNIKTSTFEQCTSLLSINLPSVVQIGSGAFSHCHALVNVTMNRAGEIFGKILYRAFYYCYSLVSVNIKTNVVSIGSQAFHACARLKTIEFNNDEIVGVPVLESEMMYIASDLKIKVPSSLVEAWKNATNWKAFTDDQIVAKDN